MKAKRKAGAVRLKPMQVWALIWVPPPYWANKRAVPTFLNYPVDIPIGTSRRAMLRAHEPLGEYNRLVPAWLVTDPPRARAKKPSTRSKR